MKIRLLDIRPGERQNALAAFLTLFGMMSGHMLLETARDALFLASLSPARLPIVYLLVAALALGLSEAQQRWRGRRTGRAQLMTWLAGVAAVDVGFWLLLGRTGDWALYALYVWSGVVSTMLVIRFWVVAGDLFTVTQAKRLFAFVGTGSILGAIAGSAVAQMVVLNGDASELLLAAAAVLALTSAVPLLLRMPEAEQTSRMPAEEKEHVDLRATARAIRNHPYVLRVAGLVLLSTITFTVVDFVFKSAVAETVQPHNLGYVFATTYLVLNVLSLVAQLALVGWVTRSVPVDRMLSILPALLTVASGFLVAGGGVIAALGAKAIDGVFRHSLHRTSTEVLYVPLSREWRTRAKAFIDVVGQRGGQAVASLALLAAAALGAPLPVFGALLVVLCAAWIWVALGIKRHYFDIFRNALDEGSIRTRIEYPELDLSSLESLLQALYSQDESIVCAALELLAEKDRMRLVPPLILYHPSPRVVVTALRLFEASDVRTHCPFIDRLYDHEDASVRAEALLAVPCLQEAIPHFEAALSDESADVRATALVGLVSAKDDLHPRVQSILDTLVNFGSAEAKRTLASAIRSRPSPKFDAVLLELAKHPNPKVGCEVARAMRSAPKADYVPALLPLLERRATRDEARRTLVAIGDEALAALSASLADPTVDEAIRLHVPRTISRFDPEKAAPILLERLENEASGALRYKLLRALGGVRVRQPDLRLDPDVLDRIIDHTLERHFQRLDWKVALREQVTRRPEWETEEHQLVVRLLDAGEKHSMERLFRLFSLRYPREDFRRIHRGVEGGGRADLASSRELLENALPSPRREAVLGLVDDVPDERRLAAGVRYHRSRRRRDDELFRELLMERSPHLQYLVSEQVQAVGLGNGSHGLEELCAAACESMEAVLGRAQLLLERRERE